MSTKYNPLDKDKLFNEEPYRTFFPIEQETIDRAENARQKVIQDAIDKLTLSELD